MLIGVVGKTNVGKSTFFKASTLAEVEIFNRPFVTIKPNHGCGFVRVKCAEREFKTKCKPNLGYCINGARFVPVDLLDVAGLVPDAHKGEGLGTQFLDDLRQADVLIHVIDASGSTNALGESVPAGSYDPANDIKFLEVEIDMWFYGLLEKNWERFARRVQQERAKVVEA
ncbi:50S ribosome-binding GTPase, partial [Candidatus Woesearchaeota archaeon]|nr:50S ribosome-binding GTPase [Candidatus Woesearchaeota archaeon]